MSSGGSGGLSNNTMGPFSTEYELLPPFLIKILMDYFAQDRGLHPVVQRLDADNRSSYLFRLCWPLLSRRLLSLP